MLCFPKYILLTRLPNKSNIWTFTYAGLFSLYVIIVEALNGLGKFWFKWKSFEIFVWLLVMEINTGKFKELSILIIYTSSKNNPKSPSPINNELFLSIILIVLNIE